MTDLNRPDSNNLDAIQSNGTAIPANRVFSGTALPGALGCTLASATTYYVPFGAQRSPVPREAPYVELWIRWDAAAILTITFESAHAPATFQGPDPRGPAQLSDVDTTAGFWQQESPAAADVRVTGGSYTAPTLSVAGGSAGGALIRFPLFTSPRGRIKVVVGGTGGLVRFGVHGKVAA